MENKKRHQWVKEDIKEMLEAWTTKTSEEIAKDLNLSRHSVNYMIARIRKLGYKVPRKRRVSVIDSLIREVLEEL